MAITEIDAMDAVDELVARSKPHRELQAFHDFHRAHPEVLDFLVGEIRLRIDHGFTSFSYHSLWEYARWKLELAKGPGERFTLNDHATPFYARAITILHPEEFNGRAEFRTSRADEIFGVVIAPAKAKSYARVLQWANGSALHLGWRPTCPHVVSSVLNLRPDIHTARIESP